MDTILLFKKDLEHYPLDQLTSLHKYFKLPAADKKNDLLWILALHQSQTNKIGQLPPVAVDNQIYAGHVVVPIDITFAADDGINYYDCPALFTIIFDHPDQSVAQSIVDFIQNGPEEEVEALLKPILEILENKLLELGDNIGIENGTIDSSGHAVSFNSSNRQDFASDDYNFVKVGTPVDDYKIDTAPEENCLEFVELHVPYLPEQYTKLYNIFMPVKSAYKR